MNEQQPLTLYQIAAKERRYWRLYREQLNRGKNAAEANRIARAKLAPELRLLSDRNRRAVLTAIELSR